MRWLVEKTDRRLRSLAMVPLLFSMVLGTGVFTLLGHRISLDVRI